MLQTRQRQISRNIFLSTLLSLVLLVSLAFISISNHNRLLKQAEHIQNNFSEAHAKLSQLRMHVGELRRFEKDIILNTNDKDLQASYLERWKSEIKTSESIITHLSDIKIKGFEWKDYIFALNQDLKEYYVGANAIFLSAKSNQHLNVADFNQLIFLHKPPVRRLGTDLNILTQTIYEQEKIGIKKMQRTRINALLFVGLLSFFMFVVILGTGNILFRQTSKVAAKMEFDANHDPLTKVLNRAGFETVVKAVLSKTSPAQNQIFMFIDLDQFKIINDLFGHVVGDRLLCKFAELLAKTYGSSGYIGRMGGDEFCVLHTAENEPNVENMLNSLLSKISNMSIEHEGQKLSVTASIGVSVLSEPVPDNYERYFLNCDLASFISKKNGGNRYHIHGTNLEESDVRDNMSWAFSIKELIEKNQLRLALQEIISLDGSSRNCELLLRAENDSGHLIGPAQLIPSAEQFDMIQIIDRWVVETAMAYLKDGYFSEFDVVSINVSGTSFSCPKFAIFLEQVFQNSPSLAKRLCVEITESAATKNTQNAVNLIKIIRSYGAMVALDDFGTGFSTFDYLRKLSVNSIKIDASFIKNLMDDSVCKVIVKSFIDVAKSLNLKIVAEGVETHEEFVILKKLGVDFGQGYYFHKPELIQFSKTDTRLIA